MKVEIMIVNGRLTQQDNRIVKGRFERQPSVFGAPLTAYVIQSLTAEPGRFHLIASLSCPWSHRAVLARQVKGLAPFVPLHIATGPRTEGYRVGQPDAPWSVPGAQADIVHLHELYTRADPAYTGRPTVPVLWDARAQTIVSNESANILRGFDAAHIPGALSWTLRPKPLEDPIDVLNEAMQINLSNAVYRAGKAQRQDAYDEAVNEVFSMLDVLEERLTSQRFLHGDVLTESDLRLWPTLVRFDAVYVTHFKCTRHRLTEYPALWRYARALHALPGFADTFDEAAIRAAYYGEDRDINPHGIVATAPRIDWWDPDARQRAIKVANLDGRPMVLAQSGEI
ncbi:glutathione S-transferase family protein [Thalassococcus sp. S3]|uniref:glutathione S-transferase family protein n=1 Tax=Thalassococcus sp. S3 TaxID=2017482 RepID=UPI001024349A|nr:glutathione S-transferase C-terminal domain-containing protein [Thalassococcus sp. S3]QBF32046.1 glutathione-dependent reductase [Thalassococcus sp. S3]